MSSVNKVLLIGNVGRAPEIKTFQDGGKLANLSIATSEKWKDKNSGEKRERTEWHNVVVKADGIVGFVEQYVTKGDKLYVEGQMQSRKFQDKNGNDRYMTEVVVSGLRGQLTLLGSKQQSGNQNQQQSSGNDYDRAKNGTGGGNYDRPLDMDDDIPF